MRIIPQAGEAQVITPQDKAQRGVELIKEAMLDLLSQRPGGLHHVDIARALNIEMGYHGGQNYASQTILHQLVYVDRMEKIGERQEAIYRLKT
jgi:hypothetical protein